MAERTTLVLGGTGKTGRRVAAGLRARHRPVRLGSRSGTPPFDWEQPATWPAVPRNNALAKLVPSRPDAAGLWAGYLSTWTAWNHVRTIAAAMLFLTALRLPG